ncbi:asparagine synthetase B (glutamine-hydrolyzing) [Dysgonomonadaceae bacterium PH5-43]|nr:asparagine synthetase B (glutamine-hydrolyzing) [Dysgonomonadaceae bacterium PH5-43]
METNDLRLNAHAQRLILEKQAWEKLSKEFPWDEKLIEQYKKEIDWSAISENINMRWSTSMLEKYAHFIDWNLLSDLSEEYLFSFTNLAKFKDYWNWSRLSSNYAIKFSYGIIDAFVNKWDWEELINNGYRLDHIYNENFLSKYNQYIPASDLQSSELWQKIVELKTDELTATILT